MFITLLTLSIAAVCFAAGRIRSDLVAICAMLALLLAGILTPEEALAGFSSTVVIMMVGLFVVGGGIFQTGLAKKVGGSMLRLAGSNDIMLFVLVMSVTAFIGAFVSNTGTVALMMPIVVSMAAKSGFSSRRLLMPLAFASSMGGMLTLIGTPPNLVIQDALTKAGFEPLTFFSFLPVGLVCVAVGMAVLLPMSKLLAGNNTSEKKGKRKGKSIEQLVEEYRLNENLQRAEVGPGSKAIGKSVSDLDIRNKYGLVVLEIRRTTTKQKGLIKNIEQKAVAPDTVLDAGDVIYLTGKPGQAERFLNDYAITPMASNSKGTDKGSQRLAFYDIGIAEVVLMPNSKLVGQYLRDTGLRSKYMVNVVGIRRKGVHIMDGLADAKLHSGDVLLVQGSWNNIAKLNSEEDNWIVLGQPLEEAAKVTLDYKAPIAAAIMVAMVAMMVFDFIPVAPVTAVMVAGVLMVATGCIRSVEAAYKTINWESIVLIATMMPMSVALEKTGASQMVASMLAGNLGSQGPVMLLAGIYATTSILTFFISNTATAVLMSPIAMSVSSELGISPYPMLFAVAVAASMCFASPFSTPPNALVMQAGNYKFMDYVKVGLPLQIIIGLSMVLTLPLIFPFK